MKDTFKEITNLVEAEVEDLFSYASVSKNSWETVTQRANKALGIFKTDLYREYVAKLENADRDFSVAIGDKRFEREAFIEFARSLIGQTIEIKDILNHFNNCNSRALTNPVGELAKAVDYINFATKVGDRAELIWEHISGTDELFVVHYYGPEDIHENMLRIPFRAFICAAFRITNQSRSEIF